MEVIEFDVCVNDMMGLCTARTRNFCSITVGTKFYLQITDICGYLLYYVFLLCNIWGFWLEKM